MIPTTEQVGWLGEVLGPRGVKLLSRVETLKSDIEDCPSYTLSAGSLWPGCVQVIYPGRENENPFIFVHEMAHAYHSIYFSHLTQTCTVDQAEACALLAEDTLSALHAEFDPLAQQRLKAWEQAGEVSEPLEHARRIAARALYRRWQADRPVHDLFDLILFGEFDDDAKIRPYNA